MRYSILTIIMGMMSLSSIAQSFCQTPAPPQPGGDRIISEPLRSVYSSNSHYFLKVYFHVLRATNGIGGVNASDVQAAFNTLNSDFNSHNIFFGWDGSIDYINSSNYLSPSMNIYSVNNHLDGIDIYVYPVNAPYGGLGNGFGYNTEFYISGQYEGVSLAATHVISHQMGHILNLYHTHHGTSTEEGGSDSCPELVNGSNSSDCGDFIEDTPADPGLANATSFFVDTLCGYIDDGTKFDANGYPYNPNTHLIMSFTRPSCMESFTPLQVERMKAAIETMQVLQNCRVLISGLSLPCDNSVYSISNLPSGYTVTWSWQNPYGPVLKSGASDESDGLRIPDDPPFIYGPILQQNTPSTNMCTLDKNGFGYINNTIVATIKKNGTTVCTLTKHVNTGQNFSGFYAQAAHQYTNWYYPGVSGAYFGDGSTIYLYRGSTITLTSSKFVGATLSYSGTTPYGWTHSGNTVSFEFSFYDIYPRGVNYIQGPASLTITGTYPNSCECFEFTVIGQLPQGYTLTSGGDSQDVGLNISSLSGQAYSITCGAADGWELSVIDSATGETIYRSHVEGTEKTLNTSGWKSGIYIIKATVGDQIQTQKLSVK